ncbi:Actin-binding, cofilin/tropomyosin type domain-containing protein [Rozella allomycis CSF55]|uniref:Cofilin n=1 Tax=Rozella allomycis (strain CSF55) TaxID=988480 RepID=A0A075ANH7_ROZAC|nr:Actin-binding, cofilin/tropomyosin type domain-containing protein [Rozella allomycis CSF55]|eukprot:EPZ31425.1 Actin-binding, cofilin/tropomyosin type domain-containing protein [Rozella allomycis CSF55]
MNQETLTWSHVPLLSSIFNDIDENEFEKWKNQQNSIIDEGKSIIESAENIGDRLSEFYEDSRIKSAIANGVDLRDYAKEIDKELQNIEKSHLKDYIDQSETLKKLDQEVKACDRVLETMEALLLQFQLNIKNMSSDIQRLHNESNKLNVKLRNRKEVQIKLQGLLKELVIPAEMIKCIFQGEIDSEFHRALNALSGHLLYLKKDEYVELKAVIDITPEFEKLKIKAGEKIYDFFVDKFRQIRFLRTNLAALQQILVKNKSMYAFLVRHLPIVAREVVVGYFEVVMGYYEHHFTNYINSLLRLQTVIADKSDLIGSIEIARKGFSFSSSKQKDKGNVFTLGDRKNILQNLDSNPILPHIAEEKNQKFTFEVLFASLNKLLIDNSCSEFNFLCDYFQESHQSMEGKLDLFFIIFGPTLRLIQTSIKQYVDLTADALAVLLCIRINSENMKIVQRKKLTCLDSFFNQLNIILWPRYQSIIEQHTNSLRKIELRQVSPSDIHNTHVTRKFSEFFGSILILNEGYNDPAILNSLERLNSEFKAYIQKFSNGFTNTKEQLIFLINNFDLICAVLTELNTTAVYEAKENFNNLLNTYLNEYKDAELKSHFGKLIDCLGELEKDPVNTSPELLELTISFFNSSWQQSLSEISNNSLRSFPNLKTGTDILQSIFKETILCYQRFLMALEKKVGKKSSQKLKSSGVTVHDDCVTIFQELKLKKKYLYVIYKLTDDFKSIEVEKAVEKADYNSFVNDLPSDDCRYAVYDFEFEKSASEGMRNKICFYVWAPETSKVKQKMLYASSKDALRKKLVGVSTEIQATELSEVDYDVVLERVKSF